MISRWTVFGPALVCTSALAHDDHYAADVGPLRADVLDLEFEHAGKARITLLVKALGAGEVQH